MCYNLDTKLSNQAIRADLDEKELRALYHTLHCTAPPRSSVHFPTPLSRATTTAALECYNREHDLQDSNQILIQGLTTAGLSTENVKKVRMPFQSRSLLWVMIPVRSTLLFPSSTPLASDTPV